MYYQKFHWHTVGAYVWSLLKSIVSYLSLSWRIPCKVILWLASTENLEISMEDEPDLLEWMLKSSNEYFNTTTGIENSVCGSLTVQRYSDFPK